MKKTNELTIHGILSRNVAIFYRQELTSLYQVPGKLKACRSSKLNFLSNSFIIDDIHVIIVWLHVAVFNEHDILRLCDNVPSFK